MNELTFVVKLKFADEIVGKKNIILVADLEAVGYTCDYYLDALPFNLQKINTN